MRTRASPITRGAQMTDVHLLGDVRRRVVDDHRLDRRWRPRRQADRRRRPRRAAPTRNSAENVTLTKPGPAISSSERHAGEHAGVDDLLRQVARRAADSLGERERTVDLGIGAIGRPHRRVGRRAAVQPGEDRFEQVRDRGDGVRHGLPSLPDRSGSLTGRSSGAWHRVYVRRRGWWVGRWFGWCRRGSRMVSCRFGPSVDVPAVSRGSCGGAGSRPAGGCRGRCSRRGATR